MRYYPEDISNIEILNRQRERQGERKCESERYVQSPMDNVEWKTAARQTFVQDLYTIERID